MNRREVLAGVGAVLASAAVSPYSVLKLDFIALTPTGGDDCDMVQKAIDSCAKGGVIQFSGKFNFSDTINLCNDIKLLGDLDQTILNFHMQDDRRPLFHVRGDGGHVILQNLDMRSNFHSIFLESSQ
jgi:hypothetical protein